jgi:hypothetical protein
MHLHRRPLGLATLAAAGLIAAGLIAAPTGAFAQGNPGKSETTITSTGLKPGQIKHVWLIILENKSYDATFTGLNQNSYLWKTLPSQGVLLQDYYGTGHFSQDNYTSMVSGQSASLDLQSDCDVSAKDLGANANIVTTHTGSSFGRDDNFGQLASPAGANAADGQNGCVYPSDVPTLFNQLDAASVTWKGYAQDLGNQPGREDGAAGAPGTAANNPSTNPTSMKAPFQPGVTSLTGAQANDQYVAKHFPFPWFHSIIDNPADTDASHIANLDNAAQGLVADLKKPADQVPAFSWITPNNCSDAHDATCVGNNLSGAFLDNGQPDYTAAGYAGDYNPQTTTPKNHTGGLYASDLFLQYYVPLIERSAAFKDGGLIDITFDEANPPFTNMSFNNATDDTSTAKAASKNELYTYESPTAKDFAAASKALPANQFPTPGPLAQDYVKADAAGQTIDGKTVDWEPTGPNSTLATDPSGNQLFQGPGNNAFITRPPSCEQDTALVNADKSNCVHGEKNSGASFGYGAAKTITASATIDSSTVIGPVTATDTGRAVTGAGIPAAAYIGSVVNSGPVMVSASTQPVTVSSFTLVDAKGKALQTTGPVTSVTLSATGVPGHLAAGQTPLATFDAQDATPGGGITGSVLISPFIKPGTVSTTAYNHYAWLRTMEDIFQVSDGKGAAPLTAGTVSGGLDGLGHLGFAAQAGLAPFGPDVFTNASRKH